MKKKDLLILKVLKIPFLVISYLSRTLSMLVYVPNYFIILALDWLLFHEGCRRTYLRYAFTWVPRLLALLLTSCVFLLEFWLIYVGMDIRMHEWYIQVLAMAAVIIALLGLMRKGYLTIIRKYNPEKLKSPLQHAELTTHFTYDLLCIFLGFLNILLVVRATRTLNYVYHASQYNYITYITNTIHGSALDIIKGIFGCFFFFFPWRYNHDILTVKKEDGKLIVLTVLLTLIWLSTVLDIVVMLVVGVWGCLHPRRVTFFNMLGNTHEKWRPAIIFMAFSLIQLVQLIIIILCMPVQPSSSLALLRQVIRNPNYTQHHLLSTFLLLLHALAFLPYCACLLILVVSGYKYKKFSRDKLPHAPQITAARCLLELLLELPLWVLVLLATLLKVWNFAWVAYAIDDEYNVRGTYVGRYLFQCLLDAVVAPFTAVTLLALLCYDTINTVGKVKAVMRELAQLKARDGEYYYVLGESTCVKLLKDGGEKITKDLPYVGVHLLMRMGLFSLFKCEQAEHAPLLIQRLLTTFYRWRISRTTSSHHYQQLYTQTHVAGLLPTAHHQLKYWKYAYKIEKYKSMTQSMLLFFDDATSVEILNSVSEQRRFSALANEFWHAYHTFWTVLSAFAFLLLDWLLVAVGVVVFAPFTFWRIPTLIILLWGRKITAKLLYPTIAIVIVRLLKDILELPIKLLCFVLCPRHMVKFYASIGFKYPPELAQFQPIQGEKYKYVQSICLSQLHLYITIGEILVIKGLWVRSYNLQTGMREKDITMRKLVLEACEDSAPPGWDALVQGIAPPPYPQLHSIYRQTNRLFFATIIDIPFVLLNVLTLILCPWRINHIIHAIKQLTITPNHRAQIVRLFLGLFEDYVCIFLYFVLIFSGVKAKRAVILFVRNARLNFFVARIRYSHLQELIREVKEAFLFYFDVLLMAFAVVLAPYRIKQICAACLEVYRRRRRVQQHILKQKQGNIIEKMGYQCLLSTCSYLSTADLARLRGVSHFTYNLTEDKSIWQNNWNINYAHKYMRNRRGNNYKALCIEHYKKENNNVNRYPTYFHQVTMRELRNSRNADFDGKEWLKGRIGEKVHGLLFRCLEYRDHDGYGLEADWPQPTDNEEYLTLMNIERREVEQLTQKKAVMSWLFYQPVQGLLRPFHRIFQVNTHRKKKQFLFVLLRVITLLDFLSLLSLCWTSMWQVDAWVGIRAILILYAVNFMAILVRRYFISSELLWHPVLYPFSLWDDVVEAARQTKLYIKNKILALIDSIGYALVRSYQFLLYLGKLLIQSIVLLLRALVNAAIYVYKQFLVPMAVQLATLLTWIGIKILQLFKFIVQVLIMTIQVLVKCSWRFVIVPLFKLCVRIGEILCQVIIYILKKVVLGVKQLYLLLVKGVIVLYLAVVTAGKWLFKHGTRLVIYLARKVVEGIHLVKMGLVWLWMHVIFPCLKIVSKGFLLCCDFITRVLVVSVKWVYTLMLALLNLLKMVLITIFHYLSIIINKFGQYLQVIFEYMIAFILLLLKGLLIGLCWLGDKMKRFLIWSKKAIIYLINKCVKYLQMLFKWMISFILLLLKGLQWLGGKVIRFAIWSKKAIINPLCAMIVAVGRLLLWVLRKLCQLIVCLLQWLVEGCVWVFRQVILPLYLFISWVLIKVWKAIKFTFWLMIAFVSQTTVTIYQCLKWLVKAVYFLIRHTNSLYESILGASLRAALQFGTIGQIFHTLLMIAFMISPTVSYFYFPERWFLILSSLLTMLLITITYHHLQHIKTKL